MKVLFVLCAVLAVGMAANISFQSIQDWIRYKLINGKTYRNAVEDIYRMNIFMKTKNLVDENNKAYENGTSSFKMSINKFADMTEDEFEKLMTGFVKILYRPIIGQNYTAPTNAKIPTAIDWRKLGAVTPVKNQGRCGSCYSFSATGAIEGQNFRKTGKLVSLSEQNIKDCSMKYGNNGCNGGDMIAAFEYVIDNGGIDTEESYPYVLSTGPCKYNEKNKGATISNYMTVPSGDQNALKAAVGTIGPVSIAIYASAKTFRQYAAGIYYDPECKNKISDVNHGVLAVGYGVENGNSYWIVKNSWGSDWGEDGYIRISTKNDNCGVSTDASFPVA